MRAYPPLTNASWILFPPLDVRLLDELAYFARIPDARLDQIQTPIEWMSRRKRLYYCHACLSLNHVDVFAPIWRRDWLDPEADYCRLHRRPLEGISPSIFTAAGNMRTAVRTTSNLGQDRSLRFEII
jgi:hypothetical protein